MFSVEYPKRYRRSSCCGPFEAEHPKWYQTAFLTPKSNDKHPSNFYMRVYPPPPLTGPWRLQKPPGIKEGSEKSQAEQQ